MVEGGSSLRDVTRTTIAFAVAQGFYLPLTSSVSCIVKFFFVFLALHATSPPIFRNIENKRNENIMYSIGEYARIAQVSKRLLRYYDEIGLFQPVKLDPEIGHRYYSASQLPELNRILALKDLGLSLNQIQRFVRDDISLAEMQGMLSLKKAELEQQVWSELQRIRNIESRLKQIQDRDSLVRDVIVKQVPQQKLIGIRKVLPTNDSGEDFLWSVMNALPEGNGRSYGAMTIVLHGDGVENDNTDLELGRLLHKTNHAPLTTYDGLTPRYAIASFGNNGNIDSSNRLLCQTSGAQRNR